MKRLRTDALLLRSIDYGDADRVVTFVTETAGKIGTLARGARRSKRRFAGALEPFALLEIEWFPGRGELARLESAVVKRSFHGITRDLGAMTMAGAGLELLREATPKNEPDERLFEAAIAFLEALDQTADESILLAFQLRLLVLLGHAPNIHRCGHCDKAAPDGQAAAFDPKLGAIVCQACGGASLLLSGAGRERIRTGMMKSFASERGWEPRERDDARRVIAGMVEAHLERTMRGADAVADVAGLSQKNRP